MEKTSILDLVRRYWLSLLVALAVAAAAGSVLALQAEEQYEARVRMLVGPITADLGTLRSADLLTRSYLELATSQSVVEQTIAELGLPHSPDELRELVRPTADGASRTLIIRVRDVDPARSAAVANELGRQLEVLTRQGNPTADAAASGQLRVLDPAVAGVPVGTRTAIYIVMAVVAGAVMHLAFVLVLDYFRRRVRTERDLAELTQVNHLGEIPKHGRRPFRPFAPVLVDSDPSSARAAAYRLLAAKIDLVTSERPIRRLLVIGTTDTTGSGELAVNLAAVLAERQRRTTLVDANRETAEVTALLGFGGREGLLQALQEGELEALTAEPLSRYRYQWSANLSVIPIGSMPGGNGTEPAPEEWLLDALLQATDHLVVHAAPIDRSPSGLQWARAVDATVLLVRREVTRPGEVEQIAQNLRLIGANLIGTVFEEGRAAWGEQRTDPSPDAWAAPHEVPLTGSLPSSTRPLA